MSKFLSRLGVASWALCIVTLGLTVALPLWVWAAIWITPLGGLAGNMPSKLIDLSIGLGQLVMLLWLVCLTVFVLLIACSSGWRWLRTIRK